MRIAIYGKTFNPGFKPYVMELFEKLLQNKVEVYIYKPFLEFIRDKVGITPEYNDLFESKADIGDNIDFMISIGGDGTFLETIPFVKNHNIPIIGLNSGRLGFLANIAKEEISSAFEAIFEKDYEIENRALIKLDTSKSIFGDLDFALNDITVQKKESTMITIDAFLNDEFFNTYYTDGLIISTPTGSTAYALSVGGPIVLPGTNNFIIAPIAPHNLTVRPIVVPDDVVITIKVRNRSEKFFVTADNRTRLIDNSVKLKLYKADFNLKMLKLPNTNFYTTIRNKLMWGVDKRN
ncbi:MAG: NAD kinase [Bacteroidales bacterium]|nr:MAG: NAD kinase [Bacteroidales bacterium]